MQTGPATAADWVIANFSLTHEPVGLEAFIVEIGRLESWFTSDEEAQESAEKWKDRVANRLRKNLDDARRRGRPARYDFNSSNPLALQGSSFVEASDSPELQRDKTARVHMDDYLRLTQTLTGREFEAVCRGILEFMGCENPVLTPRSNDQGIDFFGLLEMVGRLNKKYARGSIDSAMRSWIVGQAKQIGGPVSTPEIRDLTGSIELARFGISADGGKALQQLTLKPYDPIFRLFITTGDFTRDALSLIDATGMLGMDGLSVAALLCDHCVAELNGMCDPEKFREWMQVHLGGD